MKKILNYLREKPDIYTFLKKLYGNTIGMWYFKKLYLKYIGIYNGKKRLKLISNQKKCDNLISNAIKSKKPFLLARYGSTEFRTVHSKNDISLLCHYSGFFPNDLKLLSKFKKTYFNATKYIDILCVWNYKNHFLKKLRLIRNFPNIKYIVPSELAGGNSTDWLKELKDKKVLVISPFKKTIEMQYKKRKELGILPKLKKLEVIKAVQTLAGHRDKRFNNWFEALDYMKEQINKKDFDIALISCGAYGLPLAAYVKSKEKQAMHLGGKLQLLFGIKGKRWDNDKVIKYNKYWTRVLEEDNPKGFEKEKIEGGCYW